MWQGLPTLPLPVTAGLHLEEPQEPARLMCAAIGVWLAGGMLLAADAPIDLKTHTPRFAWRKAAVRFIQEGAGESWFDDLEITAVAAR